MNIPRGYCDLRVERINDDIINAYVEHGYSWIAVNTTVNCTLLGNGCSNRKKRKIAECNDENDDEKDWVPIPKSVNNTCGLLVEKLFSVLFSLLCIIFNFQVKKNDLKLTILNRLTIQISNIGQLQKILSSRNFKLYNILAVEPLNDQIMQDLVTSPSVDIIACNLKTSIYPKDYSVAVDKKIYFEIIYAPMLMNSTSRQETITFAHLLHIKGKSKNIIVSSGAANKLDIRNPHDIMNLGILLGLSDKQSKESVTKACYSVILKSYGRKLGKTAIHMVPANKPL